VGTVGHKNAATPLRAFDFHRHVDLGSRQARVVTLTERPGIG
jgi:hypothetical protein